MDTERQPLLNLKLLGVIVLLTGAFQLFMASVLVNHVPSESAFWQWFWGFFSALPLAGTFFLAACMFCIVLFDQLRQNKGT